VEGLIDHGTSGDLIFEVFGVDFIDSDGAASFLSPTGHDELLGALQSGKKIVGVIGYSLGTETVWEVFRDAEGRFDHVPFFLIAALAWVSDDLDVRGGDESFAGSSPFLDRGCGGWRPHCKNATPDEVFDAFKPWN
jgi:hypothetical protein